MDQAETERLVGELELAVDRTRSLYEQYFMGIERIEPTVPRKDVDRRIHLLRKEQIRNTGLRFRFQMLVQRYNTYQTHWQRICREIENGTYKRHVIRAQQRFGPGRASVPPPPGASASAGPKKTPAQEAAELAELDAAFGPAEELDDLDIELDDEPTPFAPPAARSPVEPSAPPRAGPTGPVWRKAAPVPPRTSAPPAVSHIPAPLPPPRPAPTQVAPVAPRPAPRPAVAPTASSPARREELPEERVRQLYAQYVEAKRRHNESTAAITYDAVAKTLRESSAKLRQKHGKAVDFEVTVKDGKAILKPVLK